MAVSGRFSGPVSVWRHQKYVEILSTKASELAFETGAKFMATSGLSHRNKYSNVDVKVDADSDFVHRVDGIFIGAGFSRRKFLRRLTYRIANR
jgi:hypothetical protein